MGLAAMVLNLSQMPFPRWIIIVSGITVEAMTTITFALLYWWFFFFLMERYTPEKAAFWAGVIYILPILLGSYVTVTIALYFGLDVLQDFVAAFLPFLFVYYLINRSIPDYTLSPPTSFDAEINKIERQIERTKEEADVEAVEPRKTRLEIELSKLDVKNKQLKAAAEWFQIGYEDIRELQKVFVDFHTQIMAARQTYLSKVGDLPRKKIGLLIDNKVFVAEKTSKLSFRMTRYENSIEAIIKILSLREVAIGINMIKRIIGARTAVNLKKLQRSRAKIAVTESATKNMPDPCREFDRKTLKEYLPAIARFELNQARYRILLYQVSKCPCSFLQEELEETETNLLLSISALRKRIQERIDTYLILEKNYPDCYMVKEFKFLFGIFGVSLLQFSIRSLNSYESEISKRREKIEKLRKDIRIFFN